MAGELLCFQFTVRLNLQRLTRLIYFVAGGARKTRREIWVHFSPLKQNTVECVGSVGSWTVQPRPGREDGRVVSIGFQSSGKSQAARHCFSIGLRTVHISGGHGRGAPAGV